MFACQNGRIGNTGCLQGQWERLQTLLCALGPVLETMWIMREDFGPGCNAHGHTNTQGKHLTLAPGNLTSQLSQLLSPWGQALCTDYAPERDVIDVTGYIVWAVQSHYCLIRISASYRTDIGPDCLLSVSRGSRWHLGQNKIKKTSSSKLFRVNLISKKCPPPQFTLSFKYF